jgi:hypothetical protein
MEVGQGPIGAVAPKKKMVLRIAQITQRRMTGKDMERCGHELS